MLRIGHIIYSNCFPVHSRLVAGPPDPRFELVRGVPSEINDGLAARRIDLAPCSSIEYARHADRYRVVPDFAIASNGPVGSILLESTRPPETLDARVVALPTASATSVVLLRLLLETRLGIAPRYRPFDQRSEDPFAAGGETAEPDEAAEPDETAEPDVPAEPDQAAEPAVPAEPDQTAEPAEAALWIGDEALHRAAATDRPLTDLGQAWYDWTGLPFAYAVWQTSAGADRDRELAGAHGLLRDSLEFFHENDHALAREYAGDFGLDSQVLLDYWHSLSYRLDGPVIQGLRRFYQLAAEIGEAPAIPGIRWAPRSSVRVEAG